MPRRTIVVAVLLAGCGGGGPPADLFVVERDGKVPGARLTLRLTDDGGAYCNKLDRREVSSDELIEARAIRRLLDGERDEPGVAQRGLDLPAGTATIFSYRVRSREGTVRFSDSSRGHEVVPRVVKLTRDVARGRCRLDR